MAKPNPGARETALFLVLKVILGATKSVLPAQLKLTVAGVEYDRAGLVQKMVDWLAHFQKVEDLRADLLKAMHARSQAAREARKFIKDLTSALVGYYGVGAPELLKFGIKRAATKTPMSPETRLAAKAKAALTRKLRGTLGSRQRAAITAESKPVVTVTLPGAHPSPFAETPVRNEVAPRA